MVTRNAGSVRVEVDVPTGLEVQEISVPSVSRREFPEKWHLRATGGNGAGLYPQLESARGSSGKGQHRVVRNSDLLRSAVQGEVASLGR